MSEVIKDSAIKLFGKTIALLPDKVFSDITVTEQRQSSSAESTSQDSKYEFESINPSESTTSFDSLSEKTPKEDEPSESSASQEKTTLKKPDKILPCPRCKSTDTKFCYYNNYNVKQPRHFCQNCQRYWTSGGTIRNVPVGSGRSKNKNNFVPNYRHIMVLDTPQETRADPTNGFFIFGSNGSQNRVPDKFYDHSDRVFGPSGFPVTFDPGSWDFKHLREAKVSKKISEERSSSVLIPKTLRIDDPNEAAKSSIWTALGIKNDKIGSTNKTCLFKAFESKGDRNRSIDNATMVMQANPAALSRSLNFHESA